ncbi:hypothetical protein CPB86DRAFT_223432 [Serendipita vermifera]|nr:hypothetical protein CPB86DRAFT_223432 [Serendipita vermifera]
MTEAIRIVHSARATLDNPHIICFRKALQGQNSHLGDTKSLSQIPFLLFSCRFCTFWYELGPYLPKAKSLSGYYASDPHQKTLGNQILTAKIFSLGQGDTGSTNWRMATVLSSNKGSSNSAFCVPEGVVRVAFRDQAESKLPICLVKSCSGLKTRKNKVKRRIGGILRRH